MTYSRRRPTNAELIAEAIRNSVREGDTTPDAYRCASYLRTWYQDFLFLPTAEDFRREIGGSYTSIRVDKGIGIFAREEKHEISTVDAFTGKVTTSFQAHRPDPTQRDDQPGTEYSAPGIGALMDMLDA